MAAPNGKSGNGSGHVPAEPDAQLSELRRILVGPESHAVENLDARYHELARAYDVLSHGLARLAGTYEDDDARVEMVSEVLAEAVALRRRLDPHQVTQAFKPTVEESIRTSIEEQPAQMTEMLYPVVMPAIRKAIAAYFEQLLQRINLVIQQRFSAQSLQWRVESWRTGIPFAEIVLAKTLEYRVENIFLIDRSSGLLLLHVGDDPRIGEDADLISGMLTAIRDFVHDSFDLESNEGLDAMKVGELNVWIEQFPQVVLAAVIRGTPPVEYRVVLQQILEALHIEYRPLLGRFDGDSQPFEVTRPLLEQGLRTRFKDPTPADESVPFARRYRRALVVLGILLLLLLIPLFFYARTSLRWNRYVEAVRTLPGVAVTETQRLSIAGVRDPLAEDPPGLLAQYHLDPEDVQSQWSHVYFLESPFADARNPTPEEPNRARIDSLLDQIDSFIVEFPEGSAQLTPEDEDRIATLGTTLGALLALIDPEKERVHLTVTGQATPGGSTDVNRQLSEERADAVAALLSRYGLTTDRVELQTITGPYADVPRVTFAARLEPLPSSAP